MKITTLFGLMTPALAFAAAVPDISVERHGHGSHAAAVRPAPKPGNGGPRVHGAPSAPKSKCRKPLVRREWRTFTKKQQQNYLNAVKCLQVKPAKSVSLVPGSKNRYEDFLGIHILYTDEVHFVGYFQPWHRYFLALYHKALVEECGYKGDSPYWDWTQDVASNSTWLSNPVIDSFGGNGPWATEGPMGAPFDVPGRTGGGCITKGPFKDYRMNIGPGNSIVAAPEPHCIRRDLSPWLAMRTLRKTDVERTLSHGSFREFDMDVQGWITPETMTIHGGGHLGVGGLFGTVGDVYSSPGDPIFYLHHAQLDRIWAQWQAKDMKTRTKDIAGPTVKFGAPWSEEVSPETTLDLLMDHGNLGPRVTVADVMNIQGDILCYRYE